MPLHDLSYQRHHGPRTPRIRRSWALSRTAITGLINKRSFLLLMAACWIPVIARAVQLYFARQFPQMAEYVTVNARLWQDFLAQQVTFLPVLLIALYTGASAISSDISTGALTLYLAKPISRSDYVLGKAIPVMAALLAITLAPALLLLVVQLSLADDLGLLSESPLLPLSIVAYSVWLAAFFTLLVLSVSSLSRSGRVAGAGFIALALGSKIVFLGALARLRWKESWTFLSIMDAATDAGHFFFGTARADGGMPALSLIAMAALMALSLVVLRWRLRSAEVVS